MQKAALTMQIEAKNDGTGAIEANGFQQVKLEDSIPEVYTKKLEDTASKKFIVSG